MRIDQLTLTNFRRYASLTLDLDPQLTVLAGVNGAGKTSVLEGLAVAMGAWFLGFDDIASPGLALEQVRVTQTDDAHPNFERQFPATVEATGELESAALYWARAKRTERGGTTRADAEQLVDIAKAHQKDVKAGALVDLPVLAYYGAGRLWGGVDANGGAKTSRTAGYRDALDPRGNQRHLASWMKWRELTVLQNEQNVQLMMETMGASAKDASEAARIHPGGRDPWLDAIQNAVVDCVDAAKRFYYSVATDQLVLTHTDGTSQPFDLLSDGYKNLIAMVADIAWRATRLNTHREGQAPRKARGVVLIDEVELHLHPKWQHAVLPSLMRAFPNLQFVVTTHAPLVLASVPAKHIRFLGADGGVQRVDKALGLSANVVLRELMGAPARDPETERDLGRLGELLEAGEIKAARAQFDALRERLGILDPDLQGLEWELRDLEMHGAPD